jgi:HAAS
MEALRHRGASGAGGVGVSEDLIAEYLGRLRTSLRTPPERTAQILAEAEDHLRESAAAGEALGLTERDAEEAAIAAFGPVRSVVLAHRRPASTVAAELGMAAWKIAAIYLLAVTLTATLAHSSGAFALAGMAGVVGSIVVALGYVVQMGRTIVRQRHDANPTDREANHA